MGGVRRGVGPLLRGKKERPIPRQPTGRPTYERFAPTTVRLTAKLPRYGNHEWGSRHDVFWLTCPAGARPGGIRVVAAGPAPGARGGPSGGARERAHHQAAPADATSSPPSDSVWGPNGSWKKTFFLGTLGVGVLAAGVGVIFNLRGISKENDRQDFIREHGNTDLRAGSGVAEVGPQCRGAAQCAAYSDIKSSRDTSYDVAVALYSVGATAFAAAGIFYIQAIVDHSNERKEMAIVPVIGPHLNGAAWEARF